LSIQKKGIILYKEFDEWRNNQVIFRAFLQKEAVRKKVKNAKPKKPTISNYLWEGEELVRAFLAPR
jgi:hypothetical protein